MRPGETKQAYAARRTWMLVKSDIPDKYYGLIDHYIMNLFEEELDMYIRIAEKLYDMRTLGQTSNKVTLNAIKLCLKLNDLGCRTFPMINKIATRGWDTSGGTYAFSMYALEGDDFAKEYFSFGPIEPMVKKNADLVVFFNEHTRCTEIDYK